MTTPAIPRMGLLAEAVARYESGILIHGDQVTDLVTGFSLTMPTQRATTSGTDELVYRRSPLTLRQLDDLAELVSQVVQQRANDPQVPLIDQSVSRDHFPYGVGVATPDILVSGKHSGIVCRYLRSAGFRARPIDSDYAMTIAGNLAVAKQDLAALQAEKTARQTTGAVRPKTSFASLQLKTTGGTVARSPIVVAAVVLVVLAAAIVGGLSLDTSGTSSASDEKTTEMADPSSEEDADPKDTAVPMDTPPPFTPRADRPQMQDHKISGQEPESGRTHRADIPMTAQLPEGWKLAEATPKRETYASDKDPGMRVLLAAKPAPLENQEQLDRAVLNALTNAPGTEVASQSPVSYKEKYPDSETLWFVRLVKGHQVSIGCQYREPTPTRLRVCEQFTETASPSELNTK